MHFDPRRNNVRPEQQVLVGSTAQNTVEEEEEESSGDSYE
jgi:hypothetical protein